MVAASPLLQMERVNKYFGELHVLQDIDLSVDAGEVVVVVGPSGSGKSTLCRTINRLEPIDSGSIRLDGSPLPAEGRELARLRSDSVGAYLGKAIADEVAASLMTVKRATLSDDVDVEPNLDLFPRDELRLP